MCPKYWGSPRLRIRASAKPIVAALLRWWANCKQNHGRTCGPCNEAREGLQELGELRVIDATQQNVVSVSFAVDYVAFSYRWGTAKVYTAALSDIANDKLPLCNKRLPRTIKDAITLTELVGERYLRVDSSASYRMTAMMFATTSARCTLIANASAASSDIGLEGLRPNSRNLKFAHSNIARISIIEVPTRMDLTKSP